jgi:hypothetical protein
MEKVMMELNLKINSLKKLDRCNIHLLLLLPVVLVAQRSFSPSGTKSNCGEREEDNVDYE